MFIVCSGSSVLYRHFYQFSFDNHNVTILAADEIGDDLQKSHVKG